jgi:hypothetical protein
MPRLTLALVLTAVIGFSGEARAQAAAEAALGHAMSSATGTAMGTTLGRVTNQVAGKLGKQTSNAVQPVVTAVNPGTQRQTRVPRTSTMQPGLPSGGSMIASIQGGASPQPPATCAHATPSPKTQTGATGVPPVPASAAAVEGQSTNCSKPASLDANDYQSVINLPAAQ